jgi:ABC-type multidrug transport system ATPase subunit
VETSLLTRTFGSVTAVDAFDLAVPVGTVVSLLGPNGAGKTTIVRMLATLIRPTSGTARVCGQDITARPAAVRSLLSLTGQFTTLEDTLTTRENLLLMARLRGHSKRGALKVTNWLVDRFDLGEFHGRLVKSLSGGQRRRVDIAASLVVQPRVLVLDEPTTGLDPRSRQIVWSTVRELVAEGVTLVLTTQYLDEADALSDHVVLLEHGRATASGTPAQLKSRVGHQRVDVTTADAEGFARLRAALAPRFTLADFPERLLLQVPAPHAAEDLATVTRAVLDAGVSVEEVVLRSPTLDDVFLALTGHPPKEGR